MADKNMGSTEEYMEFREFINVHFGSSDLTPWQREMARAILEGKRLTVVHGRRQGTAHVLRVVEEIWRAWIDEWAGEEDLSDDG